MTTKRPLTKLQSEVLAVIADARDGRISGKSIATWLLRRTYTSSVGDSLRSLVNRGLVTMYPMDDPNDGFRKLYPNRMKAMYSIRKEQP